MMIFRDGLNCCSSAKLLVALCEEIFGKGVGEALLIIGEGLQKAVGVGRHKGKFGCEENP